MAKIHEELYLVFQVSKIKYCYILNIVFRIEQDIIKKSLHDDNADMFFVYFSLDNLLNEWKLLESGFCQLSKVIITIDRFLLIKFFIFYVLTAK